MYMNTKKCTFAVLIFSLMLLFGTIAFAADSGHYNERYHGDSCYNQGHYAGDTCLNLCNIADCHVTEEHQHDSEYYSGHAVDDGHDYHSVCNVEGCENLEKHTHQAVKSSNKTGINKSGHHKSEHSSKKHH